MKWIWLNESNGNEYAEFACRFTAHKGKTVKLEVGADWEYAAYINGSPVSTGQYTNTAGVRTVDCVDISEFVRGGKNDFTVTARHMNCDYQVCRVSTPSVAFCITEDGKTVAESGEDTLCRIGAPYYGLSESVTPQMGSGWGYDLRREECDWRKATVVSESFTERRRPQKQFVLTPPLSAEVCAQGVYKLKGGNTAAEKMQSAYMSAYRFFDMTGKRRVPSAKLGGPITFAAKEGEGIYVTVDLGRETAGYMCFDITVPENTDAMLGWGEHLADLRVRTAVGGRNFGSELRLKAGRNAVCDDLHRIGCRYLTLFVASERVTVAQLTVREACYPFAEIKKDWGDRLLNKIYDAGKRTLKLCAHVHYEDCPWREQALYGMDSRNQMLFGYGVFGEYELPRASLRIIAESISGDGLPELSPPARSSITIPSFALYFIIALGENAKAQCDKEFLAEMLPAAERMFEVFAGRLDGKGLACFTEVRYWNFYEWVNGLDGGEIFRSKVIPKTYDAILTALFAIAATELGYVNKALNNVKRAAECEAAANRAVTSLENFYNSDRGVYMSFTGADGALYGLHAYTQAVAAVAGAAHASSAVNALMDPPEDMGECTFATLQWKYDAIMKCTANKEFCLNEICEVFGGMLTAGATSYWETALGEADFEDAGSLCHAWSAVPCYFMDKYLKSK